jgi:4-aminobutyrate aminotransferase-like enzyme/Ser/Thr protein kinase RdoA (MazF antagonist)
MTVFDFFAVGALPRPAVTADDARELARTTWNLDGEVTELGSNQDRNFLIASGAGRVLLKVANDAFGADELAAQTLAAEAVAAAGLRAPRTLGAEGRVRLLSFVEGTPLSGAAVDPAALGTLSARVALALRGLQHAGFGQRTQWNLEHAHRVIEVLLPHVPASRRDEVQRVASEALARLAPVRADLRRQVIHGDLTDDNAVLSPDGELDGVIDFGDVATSWTIAELAVTCTAILHRFPDEPLRVLDTVAAFHRLLPLTDAELDALWPLVQLRTAVLVVSGEHQVALERDNAYAAGNRAHEWRAFREAAARTADEVRTLLAWRLGDVRAGDGPAAGDPDARVRVLDADLTRIDLSATSDALDAGVWQQPGVEARLLRAGTATVWGQARLTRAQPLQRRGAATVALGVEVAVEAPATVHAPEAGVLRHAEGAVVLEGASGELWVGGLDAIAAEGPVEAGAAVGTLPSHPATLRLQWSRARGHRPPAFAAPADAAVWKAVCPDPSALLGLDPVPDPPSAAEVLARRDASFAAVQEHYYARPPRIERGWREHLIDTDGQVYLDMVNNVATTGHGHPRLTQAVARQWARLNTNSRFHYAAVAEFSERLASLAPEGLDAVFLVNSGSEAVDLALRLAQVATGRPRVVAMREAYHGWTIGSDAVSSSLGDNPRALETRPQWVRLVDPPHRVPMAASLASLDAALGPDTAGFIAEAIFGNGGGVLLPDGFLAGAYQRVRAAGGVCIADEVQVGYGRLGSFFWGFEQQGVVPDIITIAKAMGNGQPLGAVITTRAIADAFAAEGSMFSSAGGSPVSCVVGMTVLDIMRDEGLVENARVVGAHLRERLLGLGYPVHGMGLYLGVELPSGAAAAEVCDALLAEGVIMQPTGDDKNVLKIKPPMVISRESADYFADALERVLAR